MKTIFIVERLDVLSRKQHNTKGYLAWEKQADKDEYHCYQSCNAQEKKFVNLDRTYSSTYWKREFEAQDGELKSFKAVGITRKEDALYKDPLYKYPLYEYTWQCFTPYFVATLEQLQLFGDVKQYELNDLNEILEIRKISNNPEPWEEEVLDSGYVPLRMG